MKTIYFIRHGQSEGNVSLRTQQGAHTLLTEHGRAQVAELARHIKKLPIDAILASPFARTTATAEAIAAEVKLPITYSELFVERRRPDVQIKKRKNHPHWLWVQLQLALFSRFESYRHSDEETPKELVERAHKALAFIAARPEEHSVVVTHGRFMRALYAVMTLGEGVTARAYLSATRKLRIRNTALMVATLGEDGWKVHAWNEDASKITP